MAFCFYCLIYFLPISIALAETFTGSALIFYLIKRSICFCKDLEEGDIDWKTLSFLGKVKSFLHSYKPINSCLNVPISILLLISFISIFTSQFPAESIRGFFGKVLQSAFIYFTFIECINSKKRLKIFLYVFFISCVLICINGLYQYFIGKGFIFEHLVYEGRISSSFRHANDFAAYLIIIIPVLYYLSISNKIRYKESIFVLLSLAIICFGLTYSRGAWIAIFACFLILGIRNIKVCLFTMALGILFSMFFYMNMLFSRSNFLDMSVMLMKGNWFVDFLWPTLVAHNNRMVYWNEAWLIVKDYLIFGSGLNTYSRVSAGYQLAWGGYPHNCYIQMTVETGIIGLLAFLAIFTIFFRKSFRSLHQMTDIPLKIILFGFLSGLFAFLIHGFFDTIFYSVQLCSLMWIVMGVIEVIPKISQQNEDQNGDESLGLI